MSLEFRELVDNFAETNNSWELIRFVKKNFIGYERESIIVNIRAIQEEEAAYKTMEFAIC